MKAPCRNKKSVSLTVPEILSGAESKVPALMGILNLTEDSFSDGGSYTDTDRAVARALTLFEEGALVVDLGAESTRPGAEEIPAEVQSARLLPVIRGIFQRKADALLSVDTRSALAARAVLEEGVQIINDVSGLAFDPEMGKVIAEYGACAVLMHMRGTPQTMRSREYCTYGNVVEEVASELATVRDRALEQGIAPEKLLLDAGIGFAKMPLQDFELIRNAAYLREKLGVGLLYGVSRKSFLTAAIGEKPAAERDFATMGVLCALASSGVEMLRVHEVKGSLEALKCFRMGRNAD